MCSTTSKWPPPDPGATDAVRVGVQERFVYRCNIPQSSYGAAQFSEWNFMI